MIFQEVLKVIQNEKLEHDEREKKSKLCWGGSIWTARKYIYSKNNYFNIIDTSSILINTKLFGASHGLIVSSEFHFGQSAGAVEYTDCFSAEG